MVWVPTATSEAAWVAFPLSKEGDPSEVLVVVSVKSTRPLAVPPVDVTVATNVTVSPDTDVVRPVDVARTVEVAGLTRVQAAPTTITPRATPAAANSGRRERMI
jgi:hypothetical protein